MNENCEDYECNEYLEDYEKFLRETKKACKSRDPTDLPIEIIPERDPELPPGMP
jgi:hypothetical protein